MLEIQPTVVSLTDAAASKLRDLTAEDKILEANGVKVYVDGNSVELLKGAQIDYVDTLMGAGFTVNNPNAVAACGCGSSFRTADDTGSPKGCSH